MPVHIHVPVAGMSWILLFLVFLSMKPLAKSFYCRDKVLKSREMVKTAINRIETRWQVTQFPVFLKSVYMSNTSWDILKVKSSL